MRTTRARRDINCCIWYLARTRYVKHYILPLMMSVMSLSLIEALKRDNLDQRAVGVLWISLRPLTDHRLWCGTRASREGRGNKPGVGGWDTRVRPVR